MKRYCIGNLITDIDATCKRLDICGEKYLSDVVGDPDLTVTVGDDVMKQFFEKYYYLPKDEVAYMITGSVFYHKVVKFNSIMLHASAVSVDSRGYCFSAPSGTGKSTHVSLWKKYLGEQKVQSVNDDKPLIRFMNGGFYLCGTPWSGKTNLNSNVIVPLKAIVFIKRGNVNSIKRFAPSDAILSLYEQTVKPKSEELMSQMLKTADKLLTSVPIMELTCDMSKEAVMTSYNALSAL